MTQQIPLRTTRYSPPPVAGEIRWNASTYNYEAYNGTQWYIMGEGGTTKRPWVKWWAWYPVQDIHGHWHWAHSLYRKVHNVQPNRTQFDNWNRYVYGTLLDVLRDI